MEGPAGHQLEPCAMPGREDCAEMFSNQILSENKAQVQNKHLHSQLLAEAFQKLLQNPEKFFFCQEASQVCRFKGIFRTGRLLMTVPSVFMPLMS